MKKSRLTGRVYDEASCIYISNPKQSFAYAKHFGNWDHLQDLLFDSCHKEDAIVFVWERCPETAEAYRLWNLHQL